MAQAALPDTRSTFIAKLLAPAAPPANDRRILAELRRDLEQAWRIAWHRYCAAQAYRDYCAHSRIAAQVERRSIKVREDAAEAAAQLKMLSAVDRLMHIPAPTRSELRRKEKLRQFSGGRERWEAAIAADLDRLEGTR